MAVTAKSASKAKKATSLSLYMVVLLSNFSLPPTGTGAVTEKGHAALRPFIHSSAESGPIWFAA